MMADDCLNFIKDDYKWKIDYLSNHFTRMWTRFNFFLVLEAGLSTALWIWFKEKGIFVPTAIGLTVIGLATSLIWYALGAQDRWLSAVYQQEIKDAAEDIAKKLKLADYLGHAYIRVGDQRQPLKQKWYEYFYQWRLEPISSTKLAAWFPLVALIYWVVMMTLTLRGPVVT